MIGGTNGDLATNIPVSQLPNGEGSLANDERYAALRQIPWWDQARLRDARILVVGAGALGNEVLKNLALLGVGHLLVVDFDRVERSNLARSVLFRADDEGSPKAVVAARRVRDLNPQVAIRPIVGDVTLNVGLGRFREADVVIGCLDNREARLWVNQSCWKVVTPWIEGAIQELDGVVRVFTPPDGPCYECGLTDNDYHHLAQRHSCPFQLSDQQLRSGKIPTTPTVASIVAAWQVQEAVKWLHHLPVLAGKALVINGVSCQSYITQLPRRHDCLAHESYAPIDTIPVTHHARLADLFDEVSHRLGTSRLSLLLDRPVVTARVCLGCRSRKYLFALRGSLRVEDLRCHRCGELAKLRTYYQIRSTSAWIRRTLAELGIPDHDIVRVADSDHEHYFQLTPVEPWP